MNLTDAIDSVADRPEPSEAQIKAGNYRKGPVSLHGMRISVENPQGSIRRGKSADGQPWASQLTHHYGYIRGAWGRDKDHLDIYLGPDAESADRVFVVDQMNPDNAKFDEHKVLLGFKDADDAREAYLDQFPEGWRGLGGVTELPLSSFKKWAFQKGRRVKPLSTEFAEATAQHYAGGGSVPEHDKDISTALPEADDAALYALPEQPKGRTAAQRLMILRAADDANAELTRPYTGVRNANKRPEHRNNRAASAEMPFIAARGALATLLGTAGDIEELGRMVINVPRDIENSLRAKGKIPVGDQVFTGVADEPVLLSTAQFRDLLPTGGLDVNGAHGRMAEGLVDTGAAAAGLGALTQLAGALRRGVSRVGTRAADAMDSWRDSYIPRRADIDVILDRAGNVLNPRPALPAYAGGGKIRTAIKSLFKIDEPEPLDRSRALAPVTQIQEQTPTRRDFLRRTAQVLATPARLEGFGLADAVKAAGPLTRVADMLSKVPEAPVGAVSKIDWTDPKSLFRLSELRTEDLASYGTAMKQGLRLWEPQVESGASRILALRDKDGKPYATVEITPPTEDGGLPSINRMLGPNNGKIDVQAHPALQALIRGEVPGLNEFEAVNDAQRAGLPAYAEGGGVQAINDYSDEQYAAAQQWAQGKTGAEIAAKGTELGLSADQFARVLGSPQITGADVAAQGYGTTGGLAVPWMNGIYEAPGVFTNPAETLPAGAWQGGTGANATELANANAWATGKSAAQIAAQAQSMGLTPEQLYQVFGQEQFGAGLGGYGTESGWQRNNMVWDGTRFVEQPTPQVAAPPDSTWTPAQPLPTPPTAPAPEVHAPTGYLQQTVSGSQAWRAGAPGAQTGWTAAPQYAGGGSVSAPTLDFAELKRQYDPYLFDNNDPYWFTPAAGLDTFGWRIGGSDIAGIKRGAAALGMTYQDAVGAGGGEGENNAGMPEQYGGWDALARAENQPQWMRTQLVNTQTGGESGSADSWAEQTLPDLAAIRTHFGLPEDASEADIFRAVNQKYGDLYSITGTRNGWDNADLTNGIEDPRTHVTATFRESDGQLSPLQVGPEFQYKRSSFFEDLAPALSVVAPMLGGMFLGPLGSSISGSLTQAGVPSFLANAAPNILGKGALSALSGGNFLEGAASGLLGSGVNAMGLPVPASSALKIVGNAALKGNDPLKALVNPGNLLALAKP